MRFARFVFIAAGLWGLAVLAPFSVLVDITGRAYPPPTEYPQFVYGFVSLAVAWQFAFLVIGSDPVRWRPLMLPGMLEKFGSVLILAVLYAQGRISPVDAGAAIPDLALGLLFVAAFARTRRVARFTTQVAH